MSENQRSMDVELERIVFIGRTFREYMRMFSLTEEELKGKRVLDCPSGACSFTSEGSAKGFDVTACDIAYYYEADELKLKGLQDVEHAMEYVDSNKERFVWNDMGDIHHLKTERLTALTLTTEDRRRFPHRYVPAALPVLPFEDGEFDLVLSAHFLFTYGDRLDYEFHLSTVNELLRITKEEVRIFPLVDSNGMRYESLDRIIADLKSRGCEVEEVKSTYEFQRNANSMLKMSKGIK